MHALINGKPTEITADTTLADLLRQLELAGRRVAVELNGTIVPRSRHAEQRVADGDQVEIVHAIGGGES